MRRHCQSASARGWRGYVRSIRTCGVLLALPLLLVSLALPGSSASKVTFDSAGIAMADGKPFFPVGIYVYKLNSDIMADLHEQQFNTIYSRRLHFSRQTAVKQGGKTRNTLFGHPRQLLPVPQKTGFFEGTADIRHR